MKCDVLKSTTFQINDRKMTVVGTNKQLDYYDWGEEDREAAASAYSFEVIFQILQ